MGNIQRKKSKLLIKLSKIPYVNKDTIDLLFEYEKFIVSNNLICSR